MRLLLDTSVYSAFMRGHAKICAAVQDNEEIFLNAVILKTGKHQDDTSDLGGDRKERFRG
jgi:hypothetical protein